MNDDARLFEISLSRLDTTEQTIADSMVHLERESPAIRSDLLLVHALRDIQAPEIELRKARERVAGLLREEMAASSAPTLSGAEALTEAPLSTVTAMPVRRRPARMRRLARAVLVAAAILLVSCVVGWQISNAASSALPGSPLYGLKRGEETLALNLAWSDQRRGEVLAAVADHRLTEMQAEAEQHNDSLVQSLAGELDGTMRQFIGLTATMTQRHENTTVVTADLAHELTIEYSALHMALQDGDVTLAQALTTTTQSEMSAISNSHISLPPSAMNPPVSGGTPPGTTPAGGPHATGSPGAKPTHTPPVGPGNSNGNGSGNGNGNGGQGGVNPSNGGRGHSSGSGAPGSSGTQPFGATHPHSGTVTP